MNSALRKRTFEFLRESGFFIPYKITKTKPGEQIIIYRKESVNYYFRISVNFHN